MRCLLSVKHFSEQGNCGLIEGSNRFADFTDVVGIAVKIPNAKRADSLRESALLLQAIEYGRSEFGAVEAFQLHLRNLVVHDINIEVVNRHIGEAEAAHGASGARA